jgi:hypothetical protein
VTDLGKVVVEQIVFGQLELDAVDVVGRGLGVGAEHRDELAVAVEHGPQRSALRPSVADRPPSVIFEKLVVPQARTQRRGYGFRVPAEVLDARCCTVGNSGRPRSFPCARPCRYQFYSASSLCRDESATTTDEVSLCAAPSCDRLGIDRLAARSQKRGQFVSVFIADRDLVAFRCAITEPNAKHIRMDREWGLVGALQRSSHRDTVSTLTG